MCLTRKYQDIMFLYNACQNCEATVDDFVSYLTITYLKYFAPYQIIYHGVIVR